MSAASKPPFAGEVRRVRLGDVCEVVHGKNQHSVESDVGTYPIYGSGGRMGYATAYLCPANTVVVGRKGTINRPLFVREPLWNVDTAFGLVANRDVLLPEFLYHFCLQFDFSQLNRAVTIPSLTKKNILEIEMPLPSVAGQQEVVTRLQLVERLEGSLRRQLSLLDDLVKSRFVEMFGDGSVFTPCLMSDLVSNIVSGSNVGGVQRPLLDGEYAVLKISAVTKGTFNPTEYKVVDIDQLPSRMIHPKRGDLLFSRANTSEMVGATAIVNADYDHLFLPDKLWRLDAASDVNSVFLKQLLSSPALRSAMSKASTGTSGSMQNISMAKFRKLRSFKPPISLQREFAAFAAEVAKSRVVVRQQVEKLQTLYDSLAQDYFG